MTPETAPGGEAAAAQPLDGAGTRVAPEGPGPYPVAMVLLTAWAAFRGVMAGTELMAAVVMPGLLAEDGAMVSEGRQTLMKALLVFDTVVAGLTLTLALAVVVTMVLRQRSFIDVAVAFLLLQLAVAVLDSTVFPAVLKHVLELGHLRDAGFDARVVMRVLAYSVTTLYVALSPGVRRSLHAGAVRGE